MIPRILTTLTTPHLHLQLDAATPAWGGETPAGDMGATPGGKKAKSRWDETPAGAALGPGATPASGKGGKEVSLVS